MQQYLFRGKRKDNGEWVTGSVVIEYEGTHHIVFWVSKLIEPENNYWEQVEEMVEVVPETVGQFINFLDKREAKIFEGDIVKCYDYAEVDKIHIGIITETPPCYSLKIPGRLIYDTPCVKSWENDIYLDQWCNAGSIEVIGNIHDNPELLNPASGQAGINNVFDPKEQAAEGQEQATEQVAAAESAAQEQALEADAEEGGAEG